MSDLTVRMLGPLEATVDGRRVDLGGPRQRAVFALLLIARGEVVSVDRLIDDLWRGEPPPRATGALQAYVSNLRRVLEPDRAPRMPSSYLVSAPLARLLGRADAARTHFAEAREIAEGCGSQPWLALLAADAD